MLMTSINEQQVKPILGSCAVDINISSRDVYIPQSGPKEPKPDPVSRPSTFGDLILEKMYSDTVHMDMAFTFDSYIDRLSAEDTLEISSDVDADRDEGRTTGMSVDLQKLGIKEYLSKDSSQSRTIRAHKLVLCQWPHFKAMFEGGFAESSPAINRFKSRTVRHRYLSCLSALCTRKNRQKALTWKYTRTHLKTKRMQAGGSLHCGPHVQCPIVSRASGRDNCGESGSRERHSFPLPHQIQVLSGPRLSSQVCGRALRLSDNDELNSQHVQGPSRCAG